MTMQECWDAVTQVTTAPRVQISMMLAAGLESSWQSVAQYGGGPGRGMWQVEAAEGGWHYGRISVADAMNPVTAARYMLGDFQRASLDVSDADYARDPAEAYGEVAFRAERPAARYPADRVAARWATLQPFLASKGVGCRHRAAKPRHAPRRAIHGGLWRGFAPHPRGA